MSKKDTKKRKPEYVKKPKADVYQEVTDLILADLKRKLPPWSKSWTGGRHNNPTTGTYYSGINVLLLDLSNRWMGFKSAGWMTFNAAKKLGLQIEKGSKATKIVCWKVRQWTTETTTTDDSGVESTEEQDHSTLYPIYHAIFNLDQVSDPDKTGVLRKLRRKSTKLRKAVTLDQPQALIDATEAKIEHVQQNKAYYSTSEDKIVLPLLKQFTKSNDYYATALHELTHWTGHKSRLDRKLNETGQKQYAKEELVAEMGAAFLCAQVGIPYQTQHASYIKSWIKVLENDKKFIAWAAQRAQKAANFILAMAPAKKAAKKAA